MRISRGALACRACHGLVYRSQTHGRWDGRLLDQMADRLETLPAKPGPKGRRYRAWARRVEGVHRHAEEWVRRWELRWAPLIAGERDPSRKVLRFFRSLRGR